MSSQLLSLGGWLEHSALYKTPEKYDNITISNMIISPYCAQVEHTLRRDYVLYINCLFIDEIIIILSTLKQTMGQFHTSEGPSVLTIHSHCSWLRHYHVSGYLLQTAQTWANVGVCSASCAHALGIIFVSLSLFVCLTGDLGHWVL